MKIKTIHQNFKRVQNASRYKISSSKVVLFV